MEITLGRYFLPTIPRLWWVWGRGGVGGCRGEVWRRCWGGACGGGEGGVLDRGETLCEPPGTLLPPDGSLPPALQPSTSWAVSGPTLTFRPAVG